MLLNRIASVTRLGEVFKNILRPTQMVYITEPIGWSIKWDGNLLVKYLAKYFTCRCSSSDWGVRSQIRHYGSINTICDKKGIKNKKSRFSVLTWFHILDTDYRTRLIPDLNNKIDVVHTACQLSRERLIQNGLDPQKIVVIPLGIDLDIFKCFSAVEKQQIKKELNLPQDKIIIGSFQKDGTGWGEGTEAKMMKGPDIFCDAVIRLAKNFNIHVLLTGPARGYVKNRLQKSGIGFTHKYLKNYPEIVNYYNALDLYLITSREEGGPKAIFESMACGVPLVTTRVGMVPEVVNDNADGLVAAVDDVDAIYQKAASILTESDTRDRIIKNALSHVKQYEFSKIAENYFDKIYSRFI